MPNSNNFDLTVCDESSLGDDRNEIKTNKTGYTNPFPQSNNFNFNFINYLTKEKCKMVASRK